MRFTIGKGARREGRVRESLKISATRNANIPAVFIAIWGRWRFGTAEVNPNRGYAGFLAFYLVEAGRLDSNGFVRYQEFPTRATLYTHGRGERAKSASCYSVVSAWILLPFWRPRRTKMGQN